MTSDFLLRSLENLLNKKKRLINSFEDDSSKIYRIANNFLENEFGHTSQNKMFNVSYNQKDKILLVESGNKIMANELMLRLIDLYSNLEKEKIKLNKILIR